MAELFRLVNYYNLPRLNPIKPPFSYGFPMVFLWFSYGFPMVFLWFSYGFPMVCGILMSLSAAWCRPSCFDDAATLHMNITWDSKMQNAGFSEGRSDSLISFFCWTSNHQASSIKAQSSPSYVSWCINPSTRLSEFESLRGLTKSSCHTTNQI